MIEVSGVNKFFVEPVKCHRCAQKKFADLALYSCDTSYRCIVSQKHIAPFCPLFR